MSLYISVTLSVNRKCSMIQGAAFQSAHPLLTAADVTCDLDSAPLFILSLPTLTQ